jgi:hypothetical protein
MFDRFIFSAIQAGRCRRSIQGWSGHCSSREVASRRSNPVGQLGRQIREDLSLAKLVERHRAVHRWGYVLCPVLTLLLTPKSTQQSMQLLGIALSPRASFVVVVHFGTLRW